MNQPNRFCTYYGHDQYYAFLICTYQQCVHRWCCSQCLADNTHKHSMPNQNHIMNQQQVSEKVKQDLEKIQIDYQGLQIEQLLSTLLKKFQKLRQLNNLFHQHDNLFLQSLQKQVDGSNFIKLNNKVLNKWLNFHQQMYFEIQTRQILLLSIQQQLNKVTKHLEEYQDIENKDLNLKNYDIKEINKEQAILYNIQQFLKLNNCNQGYIQAFMLNKLWKLINQSITLSSLQFTHDSKQLFFGDCQGFVYGFWVEKLFKKKFQMKIHQAEILSIKIKNQCLLTCSKDGTIIQTDFITKKQIFQVQSNWNFQCLIGIDYTYFNNLIIVAFDKVINIWDWQNSCIFINYLSDYQLKQIQLSDNQQNILSLDNEGNLYKWKIDYQNKQSVKLDQIKSFNKIIGFQLANDQDLLLICQQQYEKLGNDGELIIKENHKLQLKIIQFSEGEIGDFNYVVFYDQNKYYLAKAVN